ncbi:MAG: alpha/beta fold hydrolase [Burkholderiales bacterium]|nr:alpha/beta fold hydrolase [Burkholderiales bacterium]
MSAWTKIVLPLLGVPLALLAAAIVFGGPSQPQPMGSISDPFRSVDYGNLPPLQRLAARDGTPLAFRSYLPAGTPRGSVVLLHGSSADSRSQHVLAQALQQAGLAAYALDVRGHGGSGEKGRIGHPGQLDEDLEDFMRTVEPARPSTLAGFSAGGGFALRIAGSERQALFDRYLLLAPFLSQNAPTYRPDSGGWVSVGVPRIVGLSVLNAFGIHALDHLVVTRFALNEQAQAMLTPAYSHALALNYRPPADWQATIRAARQPMQVLVGAQDEAFDASRFADAFATAGRPVPVTVLPGIGHAALTLQPQALQAVVAAALAEPAAH